MLFKWSKSLVVALLSAATYSAAQCTPADLARIWNNGTPRRNLQQHIQAPSDGAYCSGAHLTSSLLNALQGGTVMNVILITISSNDTGLLEVVYDYLDGIWYNCPVKTLWNDDGPDFGAHLLQYYNPATGLVIQVPAIFPQFGWTSYTIHDIQAICQDVMNDEMCMPPPRIPHRRPVAPQRVVDNNGHLTCIRLALAGPPNPRKVYAKTCFPAKAGMRGPPPYRPFANRLDPLSSQIYTSGDIC